MEACLENRRHRFAIYVEQMKGLSPLAKLNQGYSYVAGAAGANIKSVRQVKPGDKIKVYMTDGSVQAEVREIEEEPDGRKEE